MEQYREELERSLINKDLSVKQLGELLYQTKLKKFYKEKPVDIETFIESDRFLGSLYNDTETGKSTFYPFWKEQLKQIHVTPFYQPYFEVVTLLPIGSGKSISATASIAYEIYKILCLKDPHSFYGIAKSDVIVFCLFSATKNLAEDVNWAKLESIFDVCPWFIENAPLPERGRISATNTVQVKEKISIDLGSKSIHVTGKAVFGGILDEANFQNAKSNQAMKSYTTILRRMESRFSKEGGNIPGVLWLCSSPNVSTDFLIDRISSSEEDVYNRSFVIKNFPRWEIDGHIPRKYDTETFPVFVGDNLHDPCILEEHEILKFDASKVYRVPKSNFLHHFKDDLVTSIKDIIGWAAMPAISLFKSADPIKKISVLKHRFGKQIYNLEFSNPNNELIEGMDLNYFRHPNFPEAYRFIHIDIGLKNDRLGIGCVYALPNKEMMYSKETESIYTTDRMYYVDFAVAVEAIKGQEIPLKKVEEFLVFLKRIKYPIHTITVDSFQSDYFRQRMIEHGFNSEKQSVDTTRQPYLSLKNYIMMEKILMPLNDLLMYELRHLQDTGKKIDHLENTSKDLSDGVAGSLWKCATSPIIINPSKITEINKEGSLKKMFKTEDLKRKRDIISREYHYEYSNI
jgi:hypothetical protein